MLFCTRSWSWPKLLAVAAAILLTVGFSATAFGKPIPAGEPDDPSFPSYGSGKISVRIFTDYYCGPCQALEPELEPLIEKLVKKGSIRVTFVDTPVHAESIPLMRHFLYSLKKKNTFENAMATRSALFEAAKKKISEEKALEAWLKEKKIAYTPFDVKPTFMRINNLLQSEGIKQTPSCVIEKNGKSEIVTRGSEIIKTLKAIK